MYYEWIQQHKKTITLCLVVFLLVIFAWGITTYITRAGKVGVTIKTVPSDATVLINDKPASSGTHWLVADTYEITAQKDGFKTRTKTVIVSGDKNQNAVALSLTPVSDVAKRWAEANEYEYKKNEEYGAIEARANGAYFQAKNPIAKVLPYTDPYYEIGFKQSEGDTVIITIDTPSPRYRYLAIQKFRDLGFNPTEYRIQFTDFKNPLEAGNE